VFALFGTQHGCGGGSPVRPLDVSLGSSRDDAVAALRHHDYCRAHGPKQQIENYPRCDSVGMDLAESWVVAHYDRDGKLERVTRYERQPSDNTAAERWEKLVASARERLGAESADARKRLGEVAEPPDGTVAWAAWFTQDAAAIKALYLVRSTTERSPNVVEEIRWALSAE
jgi:hypothetical protein